MARFFTFIPGVSEFHIPSRAFPTILLPLNLLDSIRTRQGLFEDSLIEWSRQFCSLDSVFVDVGAHTGTYSVLLAPRCLEVHAFEPQRETYYGLAGSVALSGTRNVVCHECALGDKEGTMDLHVVSQDGGGSTLLVPPVCTPVSETRSVQVKTLDDCVFPARVGFIKMDVEGFESNVMEGGARLMERDRPTILSEINSGTYDPTEYPVLDRLGYGVVPVQPYPSMFLATDA